MVVVTHVYIYILFFFFPFRSGIVDAYLKVLTAPPPMPSCGFLMMVPHVLHALCLTHDGASRVQEADVFPSVRNNEDREIG